MRFETLEEYRTKPVELTPDEWRALASINKWIAIRPSLLGEGFYELTPDSHVGAMNLESLSIEIRPKIPIDRVLFLIAYSLDSASWRETPFDYGEQDSLVEAIIPGYVSQVRRALSRGVLQGYRREEDSLNVVRGQIRFADQLRDRFGRFPPVEVRFDEFTEDIELNRLLKAAIDRLRRTRIRSREARASLRTFDHSLALVRLLHYDRRSLPSVLYDRLNLHYKPAVELAKLILRSEAIELRHGQVQATSFLVDMNDVFERFVVTALRDELGTTPLSFPRGAAGKSLFLDDARGVRLEPDISWWDGQYCTFVGDVKYKRIRAEGILHPDLYQLLAYTVAADLPAGLLIYASGEATPITHTVVYLGKRLEVATLDVSGPPTEILGQVKRIADRIRYLRDEARHTQLVA
jgi:5-methylcytosine-specific restriction enzyme subunit McrC